MAVGDFDGPHKLVTVNGVAYGSETWSFGIRFKPTLGVDDPAVTQAQATALMAPVQAWWNTGGLFWPTTHAITYVKLAPIATNGQYPPGQVAYIGDFADDSGDTNTNLHPAQCAMVMTLLSATIGRGRGSKGRCYTPMPAVAMSATGTVGAWNQTAADAFRTMINSMNAIANIGTAVIMSRETATKPAGSSYVGAVRVDTVPDTQRRRRRSIVGASYTSAAVVQ